MTNTPKDNLPSLDWLQVAKAADAHGIRYRTNEALQAFLAEIGSAPDEDTCPACGGSGHYGDAARRAINGEIPGPKDNAAGWKIITDDAKTAGRILLLWVPTGGLGEHVELGYWSAILDKWVNTYGKAFSAAPDRWATLAPFIDSAPPQDNADDYRCPICAEPLKASDICASDITEGTCHAECLAGSPVVDLDTGDEIPGCKIDTYPYREVMEPPAAYRCDTCGAHIVAGACDCTKMQRPVLIGNDKPAPKDNMTGGITNPDNSVKPVDPEDEAYEIGVRDGYSQAVQQIDLLTGGDGEYRYCTDHDPDRHTPGPAEMIQRIVDRFEILNLLDDATKTGSDEPDDGPASPKDSMAASIVPPHCSGYSFVFEPGVLHVKKDGSGYIVVNEDDFVLEDDRCEGPDGPEGSVHWIARMDASEIIALRDFLNGAPKNNMGARLVIVESPFAGDVDANVEYARAAMRDCLNRGEAPYASHLLYTQPGVLNDDIAEQRSLGIEAGLAWGKLANATVVYTDRGISSGMRLGIERAKREGRPVEYRSLKGGANGL